MVLTIRSVTKLNNGVEMPLLGLGTWQSTGSAVEQAVLWALEKGYRHIDTASIYGNEREIGTAIRKKGLKRSDIFITTKLWNDDHNDPEQALETSLKKLDLDYVDLYLIHWPVKERLQTWKIFEQFLKEKKTKAIGVSNFTIQHLKELLSKSKTVPAVNQVEFSPYLYQKELHEFCMKNKIQLEAYSPLTRGRKFNDPKLFAIAKKYNKTSAQILIRWALQHNIVVIPKSTSRDCILENANVFDFTTTAADMTALDKFNENFRTCWDPSEMA